MQCLALGTLFTEPLKSFDGFAGLVLDSSATLGSLQLVGADTAA